MGLKDAKKKLLKDMKTRDKILSAEFKEENKHLLNSLIYQTKKAKDESEILEIRVEWRNLVCKPAGDSEQDAWEKEGHDIKVMEFMNKHVKKIDHYTLLHLLQLKKAILDAPTLEKQKKPYTKWLELSHHWLEQQNVELEANLEEWAILNNLVRIL